MSVETVNLVNEVAARLKLSEGQFKKLRTTAQVAEASSISQVEAVLAGMRRGEANTALARKSLANHVEYPQRVDECPICYAHMTPVSLASNRAAYFCPIHNVVMPTIE